MKIEMKMKIRLLLTLKAICFYSTGVLAASEEPAQNHEMWSVDGGVFMATSDEKIENFDHHQNILIKSAKGEIKVVNVDGTYAEYDTATPIKVFVDKKAPIINTQWQHSIEMPEGYQVGPRSQLQVTVDEGAVKQILVNGEIYSNGGDVQQIDFDEQANSVLIIATDKHRNVSSKEFNLFPDYQAPELSWQLLEPAVKVDDLWFAGQKAMIQLNVTDLSGIDQVKLNNEKVDWQNVAHNISLGDAVEVIDTLGNSYQQKISWQVDSAAPVIALKVNEKVMEFTSKVIVRANDLIEINTVDEGVGLSMQLYKGKAKKWLPLPKKFRFVTKGNYRIQVLSKDRVGNKSEKTVRFKVKR